MSVQIDDSQFPLVMVTYPVTATPEELDDYLDRIRALCLRDRRFSVVVDLRQVDFAKAQPSLRSRFTKRFDQLGIEFPTTLVSEAIVADSALLRGLMTAFEWVRQQKPKVRKTFPDISSARDWTIHQLSEAGEWPR